MREPERVVYLQSEGEPGERGRPGKPGLSAYELARQKGYRGTLTEWLKSLRGPTGESVKGDAGPPGEPGPPGDPGRDAVLVPALALFDRDEYDRTSLVTLVDRETDAILATITPIRDASGLMTAAEIIPGATS